MENVAPSGSAVSAAEGTPQQLIDQLTQLLSVLQRAHGVLPGYDEIAARQSINQHHVQQLRSGQQLQQEQRDKWVAQELLVTQLTQQLAAYAEALDQLHNICQQQELRVRATQTQASGLQQQLGQKHKRIRELEADSLSKDNKIQDLEARLQKYRRLCSYVTANSQVRSLPQKHSCPRQPLHSACQCLQLPHHTSCCCFGWKPEPQCHTRNSASFVAFPCHTSLSSAEMQTSSLLITAERNHVASTSCPTCFHTLRSERWNACLTFSPTKYPCHTIAAATPDP